jgi:hypothetical protein
MGFDSAQPTEPNDLPFQPSLKGNRADPYSGNVTVFR